MYKIAVLLILALVMTLTSLSLRADDEKNAYKEAVVFDLLVVGYMAGQVRQYDVQKSFDHLNRITLAFSAFDSFYYGAYSTMPGSQRFKPSEMINLVDRLKTIENYLRFIQRQARTRTSFDNSHLERLETLALKAQILVQRISLEYHGVYQALKDKPDRIKELFEGLDKKNINDTDDALVALSHAIGRLNHMAKSCMSLF